MATPSACHPRAPSDLRGFDDLSWVVTAYLVSSTVTVPLYGKLSDLYGRRRLFVVAISIFMAGSALCAVASGIGELVAFRALQGIGAGGLLLRVGHVDAERGDHSSIDGVRSCPAPVTTKPKSAATPVASSTPSPTSVNTTPTTSSTSGSTARGMLGRLATASA